MARPAMTLFMHSCCNGPLRFTLCDAAPREIERAAVALAFALVVGAFYWGASSAPDYISDLDQVWHAAQAVLHGVDPYSVIGPGRTHQIDFPLYYPLPAVYAFIPSALLPIELARTVFVALSAGLLAYAITYDGWHRLPIFLSGAYVHSLATAQWSPLLTAAFVIPWLGPVLLLKPNIGLALAATSPTRGLLTWCSLGGGVLVLLSLAVDPTWPARWIEVIRGAPHLKPPLLLPGGFLVLFALLRWRRPEARLLVAMACVPHTTLLYEALPVFLVPRSWKESFLLATSSIFVFALQQKLDGRAGLTAPEVLPAFTEWVTLVGTASVILIYLPATIMVLRRRNEGHLPAWVQPVLRYTSRPTPNEADSGR
jgi:hypothetical protein